MGDNFLRKLELQNFESRAKLLKVLPDLPPSGRGELLKGHTLTGGFEYNQLMKNKKLFLPFILTLTMLACNLSTTGQTPASASPAPDSSPTGFSVTETFTPISTLTASAVPSETFTPLPTDTPIPTDTPTETPLPTVDSLKAQVVPGKLTCRYGPGAEYLPLFAFNATANIKLTGRTDGNNWVWVENYDENNRPNNCWVNAKFLTIQGDAMMLPVVYPEIDKLPVSPYYPGPSWVNAIRKGNQVDLSWQPVPISPGKFANPSMHQYIVEVWRCEGGQIIFETLGTNSPFITVPNDEAGCSTPSHGFIYVQEKHGYGGPLEIPWPPSP